MCTSRRPYCPWAAGMLVVMLFTVGCEGLFGDLPAFQVELASCESDADGNYGGGEGTLQDPYVLCAPEHLQQLAESDDLDAHFRVTAEIDAEDVQIDPIGTYDAPFHGTFEADYPIKGLELIIDEGLAGLFGVIDDDGEIRGLTLHDTDIVGNDVAGIVAAINRGEIVDADIAGTVDGDSRVGGIVGVNESGAVIENIVADVKVSGRNWTGGISGENYGEINDVDASVSVSTGRTIGESAGEDSRVTAGAAAKNAGEINDVVLEGDVESGGTLRPSGSAAEVTAGLVGLNTGTISQSMTDMDIVSGGTIDVHFSDEEGVYESGAFLAAGFAGYNTGTIRRSSSAGSAGTTGSIEDEENNLSFPYKAAGFAAMNGGRIEDCYTTTESVDFRESFSGASLSGFVVRLEGEPMALRELDVSVEETEDEPSLRRVYAAGHVDDATVQGGVTARSPSEGVIDASVWDIETTGVETSSSSNSSDKAGISSDRFSEAGASSMFSDWNFSAVWEYANVPGESADIERPVLQWQLDD